MIEYHTLIRCDASSRIGIGHVKRCISLANALQEFGAKIEFVVRDLGLDYTMIFGSEWPFHLLPAPDHDLPAPNTASPHSAWAQVSQEFDAKQLIEMFTDKPPIRVVVDHYAFDEKWHKLVATGLGCQIGVIDDLADRRIAADIVIDHNYHVDHADKYAAVITRKTHVLGGPKYALLSKAYTSAPHYVFHEKVRSIGVFMSGTDPEGVSLLVLKAIDAAGFSGPVEIISTSGSPILPQMQEAVQKRPNTQLTLDLADLATFFAKHDLQIGAGGGATWERFAIGVPVIAVSIAANQKEALSELASLSVLLQSAKDKEYLSNAIQKMLNYPDIRREFCAQSRRLVDRKGATRVAVEILPQWLREADANDTEMAFKWRNAVRTRRFANDSSELDLIKHVEWWQNTIHDPNRYLLIFMVGDRPCGVLRYDRTGNRALVSIYLDPERHGLGLGTQLLKLGKKWLNNEHCEIAYIDAIINERNMASIATFTKVGFEKKGDRYVLNLSKG